MSLLTLESFEMLKKCDFEVEIPITILTNKTQKRSEEILCSVGRIRVRILFVLILLLVVTNPYFPNASKYICVV